MALVKASRDALLKPLQVVAGIVEKKNTMPILANVLIKSKARTCVLLPPIQKCKSAPRPSVS